MTPDYQNYRAVVENAKDLPKLSSVITRLLEMIKSPTTSAADVGQLISQDVALASLTLKLVNSPFYGFSQKIYSITHAIVIMGFSRVKNLALAGSVLRSFKPTHTEGFDYYGFWEHSMATAITADVLAQAIDSDYSDEAFISGLLHDQGKLIFVRYFPDEFAKVRKLIDRQQITMREAEHQVLGFDHSHIGGWLAEKWNFPEHLCLGIRMHHAPLLARQHRQLIWLVHAADVFSRALCIGDGGDPFIPEMPQYIWNQLRLTPERVGNVFENALSGMARAGDFLELVRAG
ncbi:MAG: HDOD domain-containing protein [Verrucomicrobia bacterium]|nr:HDOD domain-containing protein [Verrucomicrobiota bacterium]